MFRFAPWVVAALAGACSSATLPHGSGSGGEQQDDASTCPAEKPAPETMPGVSARQRRASYWIERTADPDAVILSAEAISDHEAAFRARDRAHPEQAPLAPYDLTASVRPDRLEHELDERLAYLRERVSDGRYLDAEGERVDPEAFARPDTPPVNETIRVALEDVPLRCGPRVAGLYEGPEPDPEFDRNACSTIRAQEPVEILASWPGGMKLARSRYALGFIATDAALSPPVKDEQARAFVHGPRFQLTAAAALAGQQLGAYTRLPRDGDHALVATEAGIERVEAPSTALPTERDLTRRALLTEAFRYLGTPYGWGGDGGRDCSRFLLDLFASFGLGLPRHSAVQSRAGSMRIDMSDLESDNARKIVLDAAQQRGIVLLHFPGHIMLYLGRSTPEDGGEPMAIHAFAEYAEPCSEPDGDRDETLRTVDRIRVTDLSLGKGSSRGSFLERITRATVLAPTPGLELLGAVERRPPAPMDRASSCEPGDLATLTTPRRPHPGAPMRFIAASGEDLGSVEIAFFDPDGERHTPELHRLGGPPFGYWAELPSPEVGTYQVQIGEGSRVEGCAKVTVHARGDVPQAAGDSVWRPRRAWNVESERLYALFVEQLFDYPLDDRTWPKLQALLSDREHNLLYGHLGQSEEEGIDLEPDCADLPYFLRGYFSWKLRLPFAYRLCNRGFEGKAPYCDPDLKSHLEGVDAKTAVGAFQEFARRNIADGVHSGSGRTGPKQEDTDYYPIGLNRRSIRPGTIYADPYGHLFVIADWIPQGVGSHGVLVGADAQPDGTVGRRRFWPGSFLFDPDTTEAGAGFKAFRPIRYRGGRMKAVENEDLTAENGYTPYSLEQYEGTKQDFYDRVESLINPRALDPSAMLEVLVDALYEQVKRRVVSVQNCEDYKKENGATIDMPHGHDIFETSGPWENYSTPSRDMRLLIAIDTVLDFPEAVKRNPSRFGVAEDAVDEVVARLERDLQAALAKATFSYVRSDGSPQKMSVADVIARLDDFEMAYNPNDCVEIRWAAPEGSDERSTCDEHAPGEQRKRMREYRDWFDTRQRPAR